MGGADMTLLLRFKSNNEYLSLGQVNVNELMLKEMEAGKIKVREFCLI
jgi:hypothetical protein